MSRRDTIIIAVLVNAGLLMILFATAMGSKEELPSEPTPTVQLVQESPPSSFATPNQTEMDHVLNQYATAPTLADTSFQEIPHASISSTHAQTQEVSAPAPIISPLQQPVGKEVNYIIVTVKKGDYLDKIARNNGVSINDIMKASNLDSAQLKIGQELRIPVSRSVENSTQKPLEKIQVEPEYYIVKTGDNPWLIASKNQVKLEELLRLNNLDDQKAKRLKPGDKLRIR